MACAAGGEPPPAELRLAWMCDGGRLPAAGGVLDQEYALMIRMQVTANVYAAVSHYKNAGGAQIHGLSDAERRIIKSLINNGLL